MHVYHSAKATSQGTASRSTSPIEGMVTGTNTGHTRKLFLIHSDTYVKSSRGTLKILEGWPNIYLFFLLGLHEKIGSGCTT